MEMLLRSLFKLLSEICIILFYQQDIPTQHKEDLALALADLNKAIEFYLEHEYRTAD